ncbi:dTDP-glucose 4,6-dehydratase [Virgibacillus phasianinus]|uniref:dTDP-glucose 4,6-dehydratase n=1 Tax=Virgibacillus phasianinus TaxID=2017483 RepID=A0A220U3N3_9BACI|nr:dTDP-glucose 4,6-dehydratase [Virgibacillus phasianinus]ASK62592.1 dTDP-glucose 4,6-dehydratase [Virgibacillus phasianinus]
MNNHQSSLLVTGGAGFIGSNFIHHYLHKYPDSKLINLDKLTYAGSKNNLSEVQNLNNYQFIHGDIADEKLVNDLFSTYDIAGVIHFAAESHVDNSIEDAKAFITTNVQGTYTLLQAAKQAWEKNNQLAKRRFHQISTDEVYGSLGETGKFHEETPYNPRNPYSASKASANMLVKSFGYTYGMNVVISSSSNNYGPRQHAEKLIPTIIRKALSGQPIPIYGDGRNVRDWLYVEDHCRALDTIYHDGKTLETYNVGGGNEKTNIKLATEICEILDDLEPIIPTHISLKSYKDLITFTADRLGHDQRYAVDDTKLQETLGWKPTMTLSSGLRQTVEWYVAQWKQVIH